MPNFGWLASIIRGVDFAATTRTDALRPLAAPFGLLLVAEILLCLVRGPSWLIIVVGLLIIVFGALYPIAYFYWAQVDPSALRSEGFGVRMKAIDQGIRGDDLSGIIEGTAVDVTPKMLPQAGQQDLRSKVDKK